MMPVWQRARQNWVCLVRRVLGWWRPTRRSGRRRVPDALAAARRNWRLRRDVLAAAVMTHGEAEYLEGPGGDDDEDDEVEA